ncbi:Guanine nucleotide-binding protein, beta subunit [Trema orientale]|uniref:Guanine nucleotide-binding protein, beta subunit n=1 Tax=Trema orientale TaxID=63057 RepID=A0A2P5G284_TREOI|nr:Guanine nucleotide-binding protein, beta subunit [Trema orientale]
MASRCTLAGVEVPILGSDSIKWIEVSIPSSSSSSTAIAIADSDANLNAQTTCAPLADDFASCSAIGDPPTYVIWRIHKSLPNVLELLELCADKEFPRIGLRIAFPDSLSASAFVCKNEVDVNSRNHPYVLYALTVSGIAYLLRIRNVSANKSSSILPAEDVIRVFDMCSYGPITSVAAVPSGCLIVGRSDGSVGCFQLGMLDPSAPASMHELRDDSGFGRLWGFVSRGRTVEAVQDLVVAKVYGKQLLFVLHSDGTLRVWDLSCRIKVFSHNMNHPMLAGAALVRLWVGEADQDSSVVSMAILSRHTTDVSSEIVYLYSLHCSLGDRIVLLLDPSISTIPLEDGACIDVKVASDKIWVLKENGLVLQSLLHTNVNVPAEETSYYTLQEEFVADQLFQSPEYFSDDLLWMTHSVFSSAKDQSLSVISSIFLRRLLHPGVYHNIALRATFLDYNRHWSDSDFHLLTADGLKKEIVSLIEHEGVCENLLSIYCSWKNFCARYFHNWCKSNAPCGLLVESTAGSVGLIRKSSVSLFRCSEDIERFLDGSSADELGDLVSFGADLFDKKHEYGILADVLRCVISISQQLGKTASAIFYESLVSRPIFPSEEIVTRVLKILETGYNSTIVTPSVPEFGTHVAWEKKLKDHKNLRKFSVDMLLSLHALCEKATTWSRVLNIVENYLKFLVPRKIIQNLDADLSLSINASILVQATSQIAKAMFESALDILLFLSYLVNNSGQIHMLPDEISKIHLELIPMIQEIVSEWLIIHFFTTMPSESAAIEDFSSQLSLLQIDNSASKRSWNEKLGKCDFPLAFVFLLNTQSSSRDSHLYSRYLPNLHDIIRSVRNFSSWIIWGKTGESSTFLSHSTELALILLKNGQYDAVEHLLGMVEAHSHKEKTLESIQDTDGGWCILHHVLGCCLLAQAQRGLHGKLKERKVSEAVRCFFRASSVKDAAQALQSLPPGAGLPHLGFSVNISGAAWKLHYYQWAMQIFEQYNISEGACQFALAALEQVEEALSMKNEHSGGDLFDESATTIKGRLWANVFKFTLDLSHFYDAYCAIISNPDEESKHICLRRFIIVLYECSAIKILCGGQLPFIGLIDKIEQELAWKAARSDILAKPNLYKLLYAFEMHRHNWRKAATYIYQYSSRLKTEADQRDYQHSSLDLQERLNGLSAAINALHLVHPAYAWIDPLFERPVHEEHYPSKKAKRTVEEEQGIDFQPKKWHCIDIEKIENEFVLTSAEYLLSLAQVKLKFNGTHESLPNLVDLLVQADLYDMAFTVILRLFKGSHLKRELERVFSVMSLKCCPDKVDSSWTGDDCQKHLLLLTSSKNEVAVRGSPDMSSAQELKGNSQWVTLERYLEKYKGFHARLPLIVAETLLRTDPQIELPLWLVTMFKDGRSERTWRMTGQESNPALLFRLYVDYGRYTEATNLLLEYIESYASMRPADVINRKRPFAVWFPYTAIQRLWCALEELISLGHMVDQCEKLKKLLHGALQRHLELLKVDSDDASAAA